MCDGRRNCYDNSDECQQCNLDVLSDDEHIIANPILRGLVWIMGLASLLGNFFVILCAVRRELLRFFAVKRKPLLKGDFVIYNFGAMSHIYDMKASFPLVGSYLFRMLSACPIN